MPVGGPTEPGTRASSRASQGLRMVVEPVREVGGERVIPVQAGPSPPPPRTREPCLDFPYGLGGGGNDIKEILFFLLLPNSAPSHL